MPLIFPPLGIFQPMSSKTPQEIAIGLARAQCTEVAIVGALVHRCGVTRDEALEIVQSMPDALANAALDAVCEAHETLFSMARAERDGKGFGALIEFGRQFCGWSKDGVTVEVRKAIDRATRDRYGSIRLRAV